MAARNNVLDEKRRIFLTVTALPLVLAAIFGVGYLYVSNAFRTPPKVEVAAQNRFDETLHVVANSNYAPYSYIDENGTYQGFDVELMNELANRLRVNLDLQLVDWSAAQNIFADNKADIVMNTDADIIMSHPDMIATLPIIEKQYVVYGKRAVSSVADLYGRRVASQHHMPGLGLDDEITYLDSYEDIFLSLKKGEYEFAICPIQVGTSFLNKLNVDDVVASYAVMHVYSSLALHSRDTVLCVRLSAMLKQMHQEGRIGELESKWISNRYVNTTVTGMIKSRPWLGAMILFVVLSVIILTIIAFFQYRHALAQVAYTRDLQENLATIEKQREQLKQQQRELIAAKGRAEKSSRAKTTFLFNMSHDIRTPMNAIIGYIELAKRERDLPPTIQNFLHKIDASSQHLLALINDILEMSRIENGKMELESAPFDLKSLAQDVRDMFTAQMQGKNIDFIVDTAALNHSWVIGDANRLNRILLNLISNAYKFTPQGGIVKVLLREEAGGNGRGDYEIRVKDNGIGMAKEFAAKVFNAFERERTSTVSGIQGTGLGMAITKSIVDLMGGSIEVVTEENKGTEFIVRLNLETCEPQAEEKSISSAEDAVIEANAVMQRRILLADDIEVNREIAKMLLENDGFEVDTAANGKEAVEKVAAAAPGYYAVVLMDIQMPVMNGYDATKAIRALPNEKLANIPIIAMTANAFSEDVQAAKDAGMNGHIAKPLNAEKMMETLGKIIA